MTVAKGAIAKEVIIVSIEPITREDLPRLRDRRDRSTNTVKRLRESHHNVARLLAMGTDRKTISIATGYTTATISQLARSPAMLEQVAIYAKELGEKLTEGFDHFAAMAVQNMTAAERQIADHLAEADEADELLPLRELRAIMADRADRFGYGKHTTQTNVNVDFASKLEQAYARSRSVNSASTIVAASAPSMQKSGPRPVLPDRVAPTPIRRIA